MNRIFKIVVPLIGKRKLLKYIFLGLLSGLLSFLLVNLITQVINLIVAGNFKSIRNEYIIIFSLVILLSIWTRKVLSLAIMSLSQKIFWNIRKEIVSLVLKANYRQVSIRKTQIRSALLYDINTLTQATASIIDFITALILGITSLIYLASISGILFLITFAVSLIGIAVYYFSSKRNYQKLERAGKLEDDFIENLDTILNGFKEIYMEPKIGKTLHETKINPIADEAYSNNTMAYSGFVNNQIIGNTLFNILIASVLIYFSVALKIKSTDLVSFVFILLYLLGSISTITILFPNFARAKVSSDRLLDLKNEIKELNGNNSIPEKYITKSEFDQVTISDLEFYYGEQEKAFSIGPINLTIPKGEVIFIYGENGSGKTTFVNSILGLYTPKSGEIRLNGMLVKEDDYPIYKTTFSVVFSDFYLFNELFAIDDFDMEKLSYYLKLFEIDKKVKLEGKVFSTTNLSTGQRKRLALITVLLENKPVLVLDEWAADQDPYFRKKFYTEIIPVLKNEGLTIIAITHDDKYYYCADKLYKMDYGKLIEENAKVYKTNFAY